MNKLTKDADIKYWYSEFDLDSEQQNWDLSSIIDIRSHQEYRNYVSELLHIMSIPELRRKVVAWGEIGLDYSHKVCTTYYGNAIKIGQKQVFIDHIKLSVHFDLPLQVHSRCAERDTIDIFLR